MKFKKGDILVNKSNKSNKRIKKSITESGWKIPFVIKIIKLEGDYYHFKFITDQTYYKTDMGDYKIGKKDWWNMESVEDWFDKPKNQRLLKALYG